jgi:DNA modification methylase
LALVPVTRTLSWAPTCTCNAGEPVAATVLDCFAGIGTTLLVARELGSNAVGVEISEGYCAIAAAKLRAQVEQFKRRAEEEARRECDRNMQLDLEDRK